MAKQKKDFGLIVWAFGWLLSLVTAIKKIATKLKVPFAAFERLGSSEGESTLEKIVQLIKGDYKAEQRPVRAESVSPDRESAGTMPDTITVSDLTGPELIAEAKKKLALTYFDSDYARYEFVKGENGKTYEVMVWMPGREVVPGKEVRSYFAERGFVGNAAAFIAWVTRNNPEGYHASIPEDDRLFRDSLGDLFAPFYIRSKDGRRLDLYRGVRSRWHDSWVFVAFREVI